MDCNGRDCISLHESAERNVGLVYRRCWVQGARCERFGIQVLIVGLKYMMKLSDKQSTPSTLLPPNRRFYYHPPVICVTTNTTSRAQLLPRERDLDLLELLELPDEEDPSLLVDPRRPCHTPHIQLAWQRPQPNPEQPPSIPGCRQTV